MKTDDLIRALARDTVAEPPVGRGLVLALPVALALALAGLLALFGARDDLAMALADPVSLMRFVLGASLGGLALWQGLRMARPGSGRPILWPLLAVAAVAAGLWLWAWIGTPAGGRQMAIEGKTMVSCLVTIPVLSVLPVAVILAALHRGAPTRPMLAGALSGLAGGGMAAAVYAVHCTEDSPLFYVTWYGLAILIVTAASALIGQRALRW